MLEPSEEVGDVVGGVALGEWGHQGGWSAADFGDVLAENFLIDTAGLKEGDAGGAVAFEEAGDDDAIGGEGFGHFEAGAYALAGGEDIMEQGFVGHADMAHEIGADGMAF
jgi:hypothetical protein